MLAALTGVATPLGDLSISSVEPGPCLAVVSARSGTLAADFSRGASVRGNGSHTLWISGTADQVMTKLAKLSYFGSVAGADAVSVQVITATRVAASVEFPLVVVALQGPADPLRPTIAISQGTLTLEARTLDGPTLALSEPAGSDVATTAILVNATIGKGSTVAINNSNSVGGLAPRLAIAGRVELNGTLSLAGNGATVTLAAGSTLANEGTMEIGAHAALFTGTGRLLNDGLLHVAGDGSPDRPVRIGTTLDGTGRLFLDGSATVSLGAAVGSGETVELGAGSNTLRLGNLAGFGAVIAGFSPGDRIVVEGTPVTGARYAGEADTRTGTLTLLNGQDVAGSIRFSAPAPGAVFQLGWDATGNAVVELRPVDPAQASGTIDIFRFFDTRTGTQLLTQDAAERDSILASRPDLRFEGVGLHAVDPNRPDPDTAAVYRFFDTGSGTHLMTASTTERDALLSTRPDLVFEPDSTFFEHRTEAAGDVAVFRFFDTRTGAHFFTADAGERAAILSTRADMVSEGIAFYAPA